MREKEEGNRRKREIEKQWFELCLTAKVRIQKITQHFCYNLRLLQATWLVIFKISHSVVDGLVYNIGTLIPWLSTSGGECFPYLLKL